MRQVVIEFPAYRPQGIDKLCPPSPQTNQDFLGAVERQQKVTPLFAHDSDRILHFVFHIFRWISFLFAVIYC